MAAVLVLLLAATLGRELVLLIGHSAVAAVIGALVAVAVGLRVYAVLLEH